MITYYGGDDIPVFLLNVFSKGERSDLNQAERNELKRVLADIGAQYRRTANQ